MSHFLPEGSLLHTKENQIACASPAALHHAMEQGQLVEGTVLLCDAAHNLIVSLGDLIGIIPREETALGIADGTTREIAILSRVGKPVCFTVLLPEGTADDPRPVLSRRQAQQRALDSMLKSLRPGTVMPATVTHLEPFGAFVDIGCGVSSMLGIETISVSRIPHPDQRFSLGQNIYVVVQDIDRLEKRIYLTHKELLGTWAENVAHFQIGMTVPGIIRGLKEYGAFVELAPNLSGLAELRGDFHEGDRISVYIKAILPERMKIKLLAIDKLPPMHALPPLSYFITNGQLGKWQYAPIGCTKISCETIFAG